MHKLFMPSMQAYLYLLYAGFICAACIAGQQDCRPCFFRAGNRMHLLRHGSEVSTSHSLAWTRESLFRLPCESRAAVWRQDSASSSERLCCKRSDALTNARRAVHYHTADGSQVYHLLSHMWTLRSQAATRFGAHFTSGMRRGSPTAVAAVMQRSWQNGVHANRYNSVGRRYQSKGSLLSVRCNDCEPAGTLNTKITDRGELRGSSRRRHP